MKNENFLLLTSFLYVSVCDMRMTSSSGTFQSPNYPSPYPHIATCKYEISLPPGNTMKLHINSIDLETTSGCSYDELGIYDGPSTSATKLATLCNSSDTGRDFISSGNHLLAVFKSDGSVTKSGFQASYTTIAAAGTFNILSLSEVTLPII